MRYQAEDFKNWNSRFRANFFNSIGGFKSINLMATVSKEGQSNAAPFFSVQHIGANPPLLSLIFRPHTVERHSLENFRNSGYATINAIHSAILDQAHQSAAKYPREVSEFEAIGLNEYWTDFKAPYVEEARLKIGIEHQEEHRVEINQTIIVIASIEEVEIEEGAILDDGLIEHSLIDSLSVNGLDSYYQPKPFKRLSHAQPGEPLKQLAWKKD